MKILILILLALSCTIGIAYAVPSDPIGISIEKSVRLSGIMKYSDIIPMDSSDQKLIGSFVKSEGDYARKYTPKQNNFSWLQFHNQTILVDPPSKIIPRIKMIYVVANLDEFHSKSQFVVKENKTTPDMKAVKSVRDYNKDRSVDSCRIAIISAKNWQVLLPDTIQYMQHGCDDNYTKVKTLVHDIQPITKHNISTSAKYKLDSYYDYVKKNCSQKRNACTEINNKAVTTTRDVK